jgi:hypothetical protein
MLGSVKRLSCEFRGPYSLKTLHVSLLRLKLEYASCVWRPFYGTHIDRIERVQKKFIRYTLRGLGWTDMFNLLPYVDRCALIRLVTCETCVMFIFDILSGRVNSSNSPSTKVAHSWSELMRECQLDSMFQLFQKIHHIRTKLADLT